MTDPQTAATAAFAWVRSEAVEVDGGLGWRELGELNDDLYCGTAGVLLASAEAVAAGVDPGKSPVGAVARLGHLARSAEPVPTLPDDGLFSGWAGVPVALRAWASLSGDTTAADVAAQVTAGIAERVLRTPTDSARCNDVISGDAGILLALLPDPSDVARAAADVLAERLVAAAEVRPSGAQWRMVAGDRRLMPGFSHGTAGIAYALAMAGRALGRPDLVTMAVRGADALIALGDTPDGWALPLVIPPQAHRPPVFFGWCHGPTGTVRLFLALQAIDPQPRWERTIDACLGAVAGSGLPERRYPGFWDNLARCCGTAGVGSMLVERYRATGDAAVLEWTERLAADVLDRAVITADGLTWSNTEHTRTPPERPPEPGLMQGAAGIGAWLARLAAVRADRTGAPSPLATEPAWL